MCLLIVNWKKNAKIDFTLVGEMKFENSFSNSPITQTAADVDALMALWVGGVFVSEQLCCIHIPENTQSFIRADAGPFSDLHISRRSSIESVWLLMPRFANVKAQPRTNKRSPVG